MENPTTPATLTKSPPVKPAKPRPDFPLFAHANGRWAKKVKGKLRYYGLWGDAQGAEERWKAEQAAAEKGLPLPAMPRKRRSDSTRPRPSLPYPAFPLFPHASGQWAKKINGRTVYFGAWENPLAAEANFKSFLSGGSNRPGDSVTVAELVNRFLTAKKSMMVSGELSSRSFQDYYDSCVRFSDAIGKARAVDSLRSMDFDTYREKCAKQWGPVSLGNEIQRIRSLFKYGFDANILEKPVRFGPQFKKPKRREMRHARAAMPSRFLPADEINALLAAAKPVMKAMIYLGINCGWGNTDIAELQLKHLDLKAGVANFPRPKTGIDRRAILWPETVEALKAAIKKRPAPKSPDDAGCVFITKYGVRWKRIECLEVPDGDGFKVKRSETDSVGLEFGKLLRAVKIKRGKKTESLKRERLNFYALRHTFETIAGETGDQAAVDRIMGHEDAGDMSTAYREWRKDDRENERLRRVSDHVKKWLDWTPATVIASPR